MSYLILAWVALRNLLCPMPWEVMPPLPGRHTILLGLFASTFSSREQFPQYPPFHSKWDIRVSRLASTFCSEDRLPTEFIVAEFYGSSLYQSELR